MAQAKYQYGTSPRKLEPDYTRKDKQKFPVFFREYEKLMKN